VKRGGELRKPSRAALRQELRALVIGLADRIVEALDRHGVWETQTAPAETHAPRRVRRSATALQELGGRIVAELRLRRTPVRIGAIARELGLRSRQLAHPLALLVEEGAVVRTGTRRGACYELASRARRARAKRR
jgi:hypothetical protein